jgi:luciferase-type oxidoreductase
MRRANLPARIEAAPGFLRMFRPGRLTVGVFLPVATGAPDGAAMREQERLVRRAEALDFAAIWCRDMAGGEPTFATLGRVFDPWVHLGWLAGQTQTIALASGAPLRHALHVANTAASIDRLSRGRLVLGLAAGDKPAELPAFGIDMERRATWFRERFEIVRRALDNDGPMLGSSSAPLAESIDVARKRVGRLPMLVTGNGVQPLRWIADRADGWITCPRDIDRQAVTVARWRSEVYAAAPGRFKPFAQSLCVDLADKASLAPTPIHLGFRAGRHFLLRFLDALRRVGVNHVILNLAVGARATDDVLEEIGAEVLPALALAPRDARRDEGEAGAAEATEAAEDALPVQR